MSSRRLCVSLLRHPMVNKINTTTTKAVQAAMVMKKTRSSLRDRL